MRVLDLDLDFFLADCCPLAEPGCRPALLGHEPWSAARVAQFLEKNCGLSKASPVPGRIFTTHDGALGWWDVLQREGTLTIPFSVTHVDAHSDLGIGYPGPTFVLQNVIGCLPEKRSALARYYRTKQLDEANYLLFALAFRWIDRLENVRNPKSRPDLPGQILQYTDGVPTAIQLRSPLSVMLEAKNGPEPVIPFAVYENYTQFFAAAPYDFASVAISPRYAPKEADALIDVISQYLLLPLAPDSGSN